MAPHRDLNYSVFVSLSRELFCFDYEYVLYSLSYVGSRDLVVRQWSAVHDQNKQRFLNETFKTPPFGPDGWLVGWLVDVYFVGWLVLVGLFVIVF